MPAKKKTTTKKNTKKKIVKSCETGTRGRRRCLKFHQIGFVEFRETGQRDTKRKTERC